MTHYDVAIIGLGTMGSFTAVELAKRGLSVVGLDQFTPPHNQGSHSGGTRVYRIAYPEGTGYVQLAQRAGGLWDAAAEQMGTQLLHRTGMLYMGRPGEPFLRSIEESASSNRLSIEALTAAEIHHRYPAFEIPEDHSGMFDAQAGWLDVDASIGSALRYAQSLGVTCLFERRVEGWDASGGGVRVHLQNGTVTASRLVITAGSWASNLLRSLELPLRVKRKVLAWFDPARPELFEGLPVFTFAENSIYGFPHLPGVGVKMAEHEGGGYLPDADCVIPAAGPADLDPIAAIAAKYMPGLKDRMQRSATCLYTMTPDEDFILDHHPESRNVVFAAGFSGHGFKFAPLIALALADLVVQGETELPVGFLSLGRFRDQNSRKPLNPTRNDEGERGD